MRKIALILAVVLAVPAFAQEKPLVASAVIAQRDNDLKEAKRYIDEASEIISTKAESEVNPKTMSKFLYYKGLIYFQIYNSNDPAIKALDENALDKAAEGFQKALDFERRTGKKDFTNEIALQMPYVANSYAERGINRNNAKDFAGAYEDFLRTYELKQQPPINTVDTAMLYNAAIMAQQAENYEKALEINEQLIQMEFRNREFKATEKESGEEISFASKDLLDLAVKAGTVENPQVVGDIRADLYALVANLYLRQNDTLNYKRYVQMGRERFPEHAGLLRAELQLMLDNKQYAEAMSNLNKAIELEPNNKMYYYIKGYILQTEMDSTEAAARAYEKAIAIDSNHVESLYMRGLINVNKANAITEEMNKLKLNETSKYNKLEAEQKAEFNKALPYFEHVYEIAPKDADNLNALKEVYYKLKRYEDAKRINEELTALQ